MYVGAHTVACMWRSGKFCEVSSLLLLHSGDHTKVTGLMASAIPGSAVLTVCYFAFLIPLAQTFEKQSDSLKSARDATAPSSPTCLIAVVLTELFPAISVFYFSTSVEPRALLVPGSSYQRGTVPDSGHS